MGTVHAKDRGAGDVGEVGGGMFDMGDPMEYEDPLPKATIKLEGVRARVDRVHVDGLKRTKDDIIKNTVDDLFQASDFEDVILRAHRVRRALESMGCFKDIGVLIDVSSGPGATPEGLEVTFHVKELSRVVGAVNTTVSENEGNLVLGVKMPNVLGRGERVQAEYSLGYRSSSNFSLALVKPYPHKPLQPVITASVYQQNHEYPWSGYRLLDRALLLDIAFRTSPNTKHNLQWEGLVRDTSVLSKTTSFKVRESSGPQMKSLIRHIVTVDHRDDAIFPQRGTWVQFSSEVSGLGGGVANIKTELQAQANLTVAPNVVVQVTGACGVLRDGFGSGPGDKFYLGGATSLRGFQTRGVGPMHDHQAIGGNMYWAGGLHVYTPLPFRPGRGQLGDLFRSHFFLNVGSISETAEGAWMESARASLGAGLALRLGGGARAELNYCVPVRRHTRDHAAPGLQFGVAAHFL